MYDNGYCVVQDRSEVFKLYKLAAKQGELKSIFKIGQMYELGEGGMKNAFVISPPTWWFLRRQICELYVPK